MTYLPVDVIVDQKGKEKHRIDTLNLLAYVVLLVLVLVTTWCFKRKKRLYIHETGLAIIYGMIMGAIIRYCGLEVTISSESLDVQVPLPVPVDYVIVQARNLGDKSHANQTNAYAYEFRGELSPSAKLGSQISYASIDPEVFFNIILPPIVLNAGLSLKRRHFFRNIGAIFSYAFVGTTISVAFVGSFIYGAIHLMRIFLNSPYLADRFSLSNCLYFGAIISPTDPLAVLAIFQELGVDVNLFALVFGESILNDAVSIVLTHSIDQFSVIYNRNPYYPLLLSLWECVFNFISMLLTSCLIGILFGVVTALTTKFAKLTETTLLETSLVVLMSYSSFLTAEVVDASGIVSILLCGITQAHYTINNLSFEARERLKNLFELLTFLCENFLFLAVGVAFWQRGQTWDLSFIGIAFVAVTIARAISVYPLTVLLNLGRRHKIPCNFQHIIAWGGAARGVISYSLAARNTVGDARRIMLSTTSAIVIFSVIVVGGSVDLMLRSLKIPFNKSQDDDGDRLQEPRPSIMVAQSNCAPGWMVRRTRRLRRTSSDASLVTQGGCQTTKMSGGGCGNQQRYIASVNNTPVLEVDAIWFNQQQQQQQRANDDLLNSQSSQGTTANSAHQDQLLPIVPETESDLLCTPPAGGCAAQTASCSTAPHQHKQQREQQNQKTVAYHHHHHHAPATPRSSSVVVDEAVPSAYENASIVRRWRNWDNKFIKPLLTNSQPTLMETLPPALSLLGRWLTSEEQMARN